MVEGVIGETASDQSKLGLRDHGHVFGSYLKWVGECLRVLSREGPDLISRLEASSCCEGDIDCRWTGLKGRGPLRRGAGKPKAQACLLQEHWVCE